MKTVNQKKLVSIIIPCVNEAGNIGRLLDEIIKLIKNHRHAFEVLIINDGSRDDTWLVIEKYVKKYAFITGLDQMGNFGQSQAYQAGFDLAQGDYVITVSADLEIPSFNILKVIDYLDQGFDFVNTNRVKRWNGDTGMRRAKSGMANRVLNRISGLKIRDRGSGLKGMTRQLAKELKFYGDMHRFIPDYLSVYKPRIKEFDVTFKDREYGKSAYIGSTRAIKVFLDLLTLTFLVKFAYKPFFLMPGRLFGLSGVIIAISGLLLSIWMLYERLFMHIGLTNRPLFTLAIMMILVGLILLLFGLFGELMMRVYFETSNKKRYMTRKVLRHNSN